MVGLADEAFVEQGVVGPFGSSGKLGRGNGVDGTGAAGEVADGEGEFVPAELAFVTIVVETGDEGGSGNDMEDGGGEVGGIGG